jgi:hypothetical protein
VNPEPRAFLLAVVLLAGCGEHLGIDGDPGRLDRTGTEVEVCDMGPITEYDFESVSIERDEIALGIWYGGGCEHHDFVLCWDGEFRDGVVVQVDLELIHDGHGDTCMAYIMETVRFSLIPLKEAWIEDSGADSGTMDINFMGHSRRYMF